MVRPHGRLGSFTALGALVEAGVELDDALVDALVDETADVVVVRFDFELLPQEASTTTSTQRIARRRIATP